MRFNRDRLSIIVENHYEYDALDSEVLSVLLTPNYFAGLPSNTIIVISNDKVVNNFTLTIDTTGTARVAGSGLPFLKHGVKASVLGDSNSDQGDNSGNTSGTDFVYRFIHSPCILLRALMQGRVDLPIERNYGLSGSTFQSNIINGNLQKAVEDNSNLVLIALGTNDIRGSTLEEIISFVDQYVAQLRNKMIIFLGIHPQTNNTAGPTQANRRTGYELNKYFASLAKNNNNILFADPTKYLVDETSLNGAPKLNMLYDDLHFATSGAYFAALAIKEQLDSLILFDDFLIYNPEDIYLLTNPNGNVLTNFMLTGASGTIQAGRNITGISPNNWGIFGDGTLGTAANAVSVVDKNTSGNCLQFAISGTPAGASTYTHRATQSVPAVAGTKYRGRIGFEIDPNAINLQNVSIALSDSGASSPQIVQDLSHFAGYFLPTINEKIIGTLETPILTKRSGSSSFNFHIYATCAPNIAASSTVRFFNPTLQIIP